MSEEASKIIIDEGWKAQVQREREQAVQPAENSAVESPAVDEAMPEGTDPDEQPASFPALVGSLATQTMYTLGLVADPNGGQVMVNLDAARYTLDILEILEAKTAGNLDQEEQEMLTQTRSELEQVFGVRVQQFEEQALQQAGVDLNNIKA